jgi:hypothetical protein
MVALVTTLHDPEGRMVDATRRLLAPLKGLYEAIVVVPTSATSPRLLESLQGAIVRPLAESNGSIGVGRRHALRLGLEAGASHLHYCDFDRILHWIWRYPHELPSVLEAIRRHDYLIIGRTERAFATHPRVQRDTERITNHAFSLWFGQAVDVSAGSCGVSRDAAELLLARSTAPTNATDAEWPALVRLMEGGRVGYLETDGLEFETPDYFREEIARVGSLEGWLEERSASLDAWIARTRLTLESLEATRGAIESAMMEPANPGR